MSRKSLLQIVILFLTLQSCGVLKSDKSYSEKEFKNIYLLQNGEESIVGDIVEVEKDEFSLVFWNKKYREEDKQFYAVQIAASLDESAFLDIPVGTETSGLTFFGEATGMAPHSVNKYESLIFNDFGHHYLFYENEESHRLTLIEKTNNYLKLGFDISALSIGGKEDKISETEVQEFYLAVLQDENLNEIIDEGEFRVLTIRIK